MDAFPVCHGVREWHTRYVVNGQVSKADRFVRKFRRKSFLVLFLTKIFFPLFFNILVLDVTKIIFVLILLTFKNYRNCMYCDLLYIMLFS